MSDYTRKVKLTENRDKIEITLERMVDQMNRAQATLNMGRAYGLSVEQRAAFDHIERDLRKTKKQALKLLGQ